MSGEHDPMFETCQEKFELLFQKLDKIDMAIRGNGKPGLNQRMAQIETDARRTARLIWLVVGAAVTGLVSAGFLFLTR